MTTTVQPGKATTDVTTWLAAFGDALAARDAAAAAALFTEHCFWRDLIAFTRGSGTGRIPAGSPGARNGSTRRPGWAPPSSRTC